MFSKVRSKISDNGGFTWRRDCRCRLTCQTYLSTWVKRRRTPHLICWWRIWQKEAELLFGTKFVPGNLQLHWVTRWRFWLICQMSYTKRTEFFTTVHFMLLKQSEPVKCILSSRYSNHAGIYLFSPIVYNYTKDTWSQSTVLRRRSIVSDGYGHNLITKMM